MSTTLETRDPQWDDERDGTFFRIVATLFPPAMVFAATVLLESYDETAENAPQGLAGSVTLAA